MSNWQPIETAPKDGTEFAAYGHHWDTWKDEELFICWWEEPVNKGSGLREGWQNVTDGIQRDNAKPRLWHALEPLPEPPA